MNKPTMQIQEGMQAYHFVLANVCSRYPNAPGASRDGPANGTAASPPIRSPTASMSGSYFGYEGRGYLSLFYYVAQSLTVAKEVILPNEVHPRP